MTRHRTDKTASKESNENFLARWSQLKQEALGNQQDVTKMNITPAEAVEKPLPTDADMPSIESLTEDSDYSAFFSPKVSEALRKQALRKLFHSPEFNLCDGLDDYNDDYTTFEKLGNIVTADMKHQIEIEAQRHIQQLAEAELQEAREKTEVNAETLTENDSELIEEKLADSETQVSINDNGDAGVNL